MKDSEETRKNFVQVLLVLQSAQYFSRKKKGLNSILLSHTNQGKLLVVSHMLVSAKFTYLLKQLSFFRQREPTVLIEQHLLGKYLPKFYMFFLRLSFKIGDYVLF